MGTNGKYAIRIFVYIIRMYSNIRIEKLRFQLGETYPRCVVSAVKNFQARDGVDGGISEL